MLLQAGVQPGLGWSRVTSLPLLLQQQLHVCCDRPRSPAQAENCRLLYTWVPSAAGFLATTCWQVGRQGVRQQEARQQGRHDAHDGTMLCGGLAAKGKPCKGEASCLTWLSEKPDHGSRCLVVTV